MKVGVLCRSSDFLCERRKGCLCTVSLLINPSVLGGVYFTIHVYKCCILSFDGCHFPRSFFIYSR